MLNQLTSGPLRTIHTLHSATSTKCSPLSAATSLPSTTKVYQSTADNEKFAASNKTPECNDEVGTVSLVQSETHSCKTCNDTFAVPDLMSEFQPDESALEQFSVSGSTKTGKRKKLHEEISTYVQVQWLARNLKL